MIKIAAPSLPKGGGAIRGIGETFQPHEFTGTASLSIPIPTSPCRGFEPRLSVDYSSGSGNGVFGLGWALSISGITRKTSNGLPRYDESDTFILSDSGDLVLIESSVVIQKDNCAVFAYRPRVEGMFAKIERWVPTAKEDAYWRIISKDNVTSIYGATQKARICDPENPQHVFQWLLEETHDAKGNCIVYEYQAESGENIADESGERNRVHAANRYLERIKYGNARPLTKREEEEVCWHFEVVFDYGGPDSNSLDYTPSPNSARACRQDSFSSYRSGFEIRTHRLCRRVSMFHRFKETGDSPLLISAMHFAYAPLSTVTHLTSATHVGYIDGVTAMPALDLEYSVVRPAKDLPGFETLTLESDLGLGRSNDIAGFLTSSHHQLVDLHGEGLPGVLYTDDDTVRYWEPRGNGRFAPGVPPTRFPLERDLQNPANALADLEGDGGLALVVTTPSRSGYYESRGDGTWRPFQIFASTPTELLSSQRQMVDVTGDGKPDLVLFEPEAVRIYAAKGKLGYEQLSERPANDGLPVTSHSSEREAIRFADVFGDGGSHLVRVRNGSVECWPNLGYGRFGPKIDIANAPIFDKEMDASRLFLTDIDGSGPVDLIYVQRDRVDIYRSQSGNRFSARESIALPRTWNDLSQISFADVRGNGTACLVFGSVKDDLSLDHQYYDFTGGVKPHLLVKVDNNLGATMMIRYAPSTKFYLADKGAGTPWLTRLPFPVQVVERTETIDHIGGTRLVATYTYHHGYFDQVDREFRGFGRVDRLDAESCATRSTEDADKPSFDVPAVLTKTWYHTGACPEVGNLSQQYAGEYYKADDRTRPLSASELDPVFTEENIGEAHRALHGQVLREEVYAEDHQQNPDRAPHPYTVTESTFLVRQVQAKGGEKYAVCFVRPRETISYHYERNPTDPRIQHTLTLEVDDFGNVLKQAGIGYGRRQPDTSLSPEDQAKQGQTLITCAEQSFSNAIATGDDHLAPLLSESRTYELTGRRPTGAAERFQWSDFVPADDQEIGYDDLPSAGKQQRRLMAAARTLYRRNDLTGALPLGQLQSLGLSFESYKLAIPSGRLALAKVPTGNVTDVMLRDECGYVQVEGDGGWWIPSGQGFLSPNTNDTPVQELTYAGGHFFLPHRFRDPFHTDALSTESFATYDEYGIQVVATRDALGNASKASIDYRVLQPCDVTDPNGNRTAVAFGALGMVVGTAVMGKETARQGDSLDGFAADLNQREVDSFCGNPGAHAPDLLKSASTRIIYDLDRFRLSRKAHPDDPTQWLPAYAATLARETHAAELPAGEKTKIQITFSYSDGFGREIQKKSQAEPLARDNRQSGPRWVGSGWTVFNNKGQPIRQYEAFFTDTHLFEFDLRIGVGSMLFYDPVGRGVATLHPDHTWEKAVFNPWRQETWDVNDTVSVADPMSDPDVGGFFRRLPAFEYQPTWLAHCQAGTPQEQAAGRKAAVHAETPAVTHADALGRAFVAVAHNKWQSGESATPSEEFSATRVNFDIAGHQRELIDANGRVAEHCDYDMAGNRIHQTSMDGGESWMLHDVAGMSLYAWDSRGHQFRTAYDPLRRPTDSFVREGDGAELLVGRTKYGESRSTPETNNLRGKVVELIDQAGIVTSDDYDFKGNLLSSQRRFAKAYATTLDWSKTEVTLETDSYATSTKYDALNRPTERTTPDGSVIRQRYNEANLLERVEANMRGAAEVTPFVSAIAYDAKGRRTRIDYGSGVSTSYEYDPLTFRLVHLLTRRNPADFQDDCPKAPVRDWPGCELQNLRYTYDPTGNITHIRDDAQQTIYFRNKRVEPDADYTYDALYRLIEATGREHLGQNGAPVAHSWNDQSRVGIAWSANDGNAMGSYVERYAYDAAGNLQQLTHNGGNLAAAAWTRHYTYDAASNRLSRTMLADDAPEDYSYDAHGNTTSMPHLSKMQWDHHDQLRATAQQRTNGSTPETTWYVYAGGLRVRQVTESYAAAGQTPVRARERRYLSGFEVHREYDRDGATVSCERETLQVSDDERRIAQVETRTQGKDQGAPQLVRYQFDNHLGSAALELDDQAQIISYEEYTPFGSTSYQAVRSQTETPKRYRYSGKERDDATGLYYYGARYYAPWLGRWLNPDPAGTIDGLNVYAFVRWNPIAFRDQHGLCAVRLPPIAGAVRASAPRPRPSSPPRPPTARTAFVEAATHGAVRNNPRKQKKNDSLPAPKRWLGSAKKWLSEHDLGEVAGDTVVQMLPVIAPILNASLLHESLENRGLAGTVEENVYLPPIMRAWGAGLKKNETSAAAAHAMATIGSTAATVMTGLTLGAGVAAAPVVVKLFSFAGQAIGIGADALASLGATLVRKGGEAVANDDRAGRIRFNALTTLFDQRNAVGDLLQTNPKLAEELLHLVLDPERIQDQGLKRKVVALRAHIPAQLLQNWSTKVSGAGRN